MIAALTHLDVPVDKTQSMLEHAHELRDAGPSPICPQLLYEGRRWGRGAERVDRSYGFGRRGSPGHFDAASRS